MNRRTLGMGVLVASLAVVIASAAVAASGWRPDSANWTRGAGPVVQDPVQTNSPPVSEPPAAGVGKFQPLGRPGQKFEPLGGAINAAGSDGQRDTACPNKEPCGP